MSQCVSKGWPNARNILFPSMLANVAIRGVETLRAFGRDFIIVMLHNQKNINIGGKTTGNHTILEK